MTSLREWKRRMGTWSLVLLVGGLALLLYGSFVVAGEQPLVGVAIGSGGVLAITFGALFGRYAMAGPYPRHLKASPDDREEGDG